MLIVPTVSAMDDLDNLTDIQVDGEVIQTDEVIEEIGEDNGNENLCAPDGSGSSFSDLQILINNHIADGTPLSLDKEYTFNPDTDSGLKDGIVINGAITINGNGYTLNADEQSRIFNLKGSNSKVVLDGINFVNGSAKSGGAIYQEGSTIDLTVNNCKFQDNTAIAEGGAIYSGGKNVKISNSEFTNNNAQTKGGAVSTGDKTNITNSVFKNNNGPGYGGAVSIGADSVIEESTFINNSATNTGGAVNVKKDKNVEIKNSQFIDNMAYNEGGAVKAGAKTIISGSNFTNNKVDEKNGGAVSVGANSEISNSNFVNNTSPEKGGAVNLGTKSKVTDSTFTGNTAGSDGGAIYAVSDLSVSSSKFDDNNATRYGGAILTKNLDIKDSEFNDNNAGSTGGSLKIDGTTTLDNVTANGGSSGAHGGFLWTDIPTATINNLKVTGATSTLSGGGAYFTGNVHMTNSEFYNNTATAIVGRSEGGAINFGRSGDSSGSTITGSVFMYNKGDRGSAIMAERDMVLKDSIVLDNQAPLEKLDVKDTYPSDNRIHLDVTFIGRDNLINGIWTRANSYTLDNVTYLENHKVSDDDKKSPNEIYQNVTVEVYDENNNLVDTITAQTDHNGIAHFDIDINNAKKAAFKIYHNEDNYYTYGLVTLHKNLSEVTCESENITYGETEPLVFKVTGDKKVPTGNITVILTSNLEGFENKSYVVKVGDDGFAYLNVTGLNVSNYNVSVRYNGDSNYLPASNSTAFTVSKVPSKVTVTVDDIVYGEDAIVKVNLTDKDGKGITGKVNVTIKDNDGNPVKDITVDVTNGVGSKEVSGLKAGNYSADAKFEDNNHYPSNDSDPFEVSKNKPSMKVSVKDIYVGDDAIVEVEISPDNVHGNVTITIDNKTYDATIEDGKATVKVPGLKAGEKTVYASFPGDENYTNCSSSTKFKVYKNPVKLDIDSEDIKVGDDETISVTLPDDATGNVTITVDGKSYTSSVKDGKATFNIPGLKAGTYSVNATYSGDDKYLPGETSDSFTVSKIKPKMDSSSPTIKKGKDGKITVHLPKDATGKVTITVDGKSYTSSVKDGKAVFTIPDLSEGEHKFRAIYSGDDKYLPSEIEGCITVIADDDANNDTNKDAGNDTEYNHKASQNHVHMRPAGNPILVLLFALIILGTYPLRKFKK